MIKVQRSVRALSPLLATLTISLFALAACDGGGGPAITPLPTIVGSPEAGEMKGFRTFAALLDEALANQDTDFVIDRVLPTQITCSGDERVGPCMDKEAGTVLHGVHSAIWRTDTSELITTDELREDIQAIMNPATPTETDSYGSGEPRLFALAAGPAGAIAGQQTFYAIVTAIAPGEQDNERRVVIYQLVSWNEHWRVYGQLEASHLAEEWLSGDCPDCYGKWERWEGP
jgi:hypothetical protein